MAKRDDIYRSTNLGTSPYPSPEETITKHCDICGTPMIVNNWPDKKPRTPKFRGFIVCVACDPRPVDQHYYKGDNPTIMYRTRLRVIQLAQVTRALARHGCLDPMGKEVCKCAGCAAMKLMPNG